MTDEKKKRRGPFFEYLEVELWGATNVLNGPKLSPGDEGYVAGLPVGEGRTGYIAGLNKYGAHGWHVVDIDHDQSAHIIVILEREILEDDDGRADRKDA